MNCKLRDLILGIYSLFFLVHPSVAAETPFYLGKNLIFLINFAAGGPTDIEGRIVARHRASPREAYPRQSHGYRAEHGRSGRRDGD